MRPLIVSLLAAASMSLAAEQPADPPAAEAAAPAETHSPAAPPESDPAAAPPEALSEAEAAPAEAPVDPVEAARLEAEKEKAQDREFTKAGFKPRTIKGKKKYCEVIENTGTRIGAETQCYSAEQVRAILAAQASADKS